MERAIQICDCCFYIIRARLEDRVPIILEDRRYVRRPIPNGESSIRAEYSLKPFECGDSIYQFYKWFRFFLSSKIDPFRIQYFHPHRLGRSRGPGSFAISNRTNDFPIMNNRHIVRQARSEPCAIPRRPQIHPELRNRLDGLLIYLFQARDLSIQDVDL
ncbi:MAG: hypothetical protein ACRDNZ_12355 [Streptosporangiaceae bacterium]